MFTSSVVATSLAAAASTVDADDALDLVVEGRRDACVNAAALRARVSQYAKDPDSARGLRVRVEPANQGAEFVVMRGDAVLARRRFAALPSDCEDRRDTLALAIALAADNAARESAPEVSSNEDVDPVALDTPAATDGDSDPTAAGTSSILRASDTSSSNASQAAEPNPNPVQSETAKAAADPVPREPASPVDAEPREPEPEPAVSERQRPTALLRAGARYVWRVLPPPALAFAAGVELPIGDHASLQLTGLVSLATHSDFVSRRLRSQIFAMEALGCGSTPLGILRVQGCGGVAGGAAALSGQSFDEDEHATLAWVAGLMRLSLSFPANAPLALRLFGDGFVNVVRPQPEVPGASGEIQEHLAGVAAGAEFLVVWP